MKQATIQLETLACPTCMKKIEGGVKALKGIDKENTKVMFNASRVKTKYDETVISIDDITNSIQDLGYEVLKTKVK
ncbi:heavy-metal-associated domain-containing protein [Vagococcus vulneris]|uniref:Metal-binding protein n=1 Tax=Vagococcus vulneris TaxID=1977869 RepID=A0A429ZZD5_9ENTE|nr:heavy-metal-associated domain-containing protein [Vagococcus vulneris]RST99375.1 metal-binding protein [Vagococcus vulneris]